MGDVILTTGVLSALRESFPEARIDYLTRRPFDRLLGEETSLAHVYALPERNGTTFFSYHSRYFHFLRSLRETRYDLTVDFFSRGPRSRMIALATGARSRVGFVDRDFFAQRLLDRRVFTLTATPPVQLALTVDRMDYLASRLRPHSSNSFAPLRPSHPPSLHVSEENVASAREILARDLPDGRAFWIFFCGSGISAKNWPPGRFAEIARRLVARGFGVLCLGAMSDRLQMEAVRDALTSREGVSFYEDLPFGSLKGLCQLSSGILGNDSGPLHLAQAVGREVLVLFGPGDHVSYAPFRGRFLKASLACQPCQSFANHCPDNRCMQEISIEEVWEAMEEEIEKRHAAPSGERRGSCP